MLVHPDWGRVLAERPGYAPVRRSCCSHLAVLSLGQFSCWRCVNQIQAEMKQKCEVQEVMFSIIPLSSVAETQRCLPPPLVISIQVLQSWCLTCSKALHYWTVVNALKFGKFVFQRKVGVGTLGFEWQSCTAGPVLVVPYWSTHVSANISLQTFAVCVYLLAG